MGKPDADGFVPDDDDGFVPDKPDTVAPGGLAGVVTGKPAPVVAKGAAYGRGALQGASLGFGDEISAATDALLSHVPGVRTVAEKINQIGGEGGGLPVNDPNITYAKRRDSYRKKNAEAQQAHPVAYGAGEVTGAIPTSVALGNFGGFLGGPASTALGGGTATLGKAIGTGATLGAVGGAGLSTADTAGGVAKDALLGAGLGAATGGVLHGATKAVSAAVGGAGERIADRAGSNLEQGAKKKAYLAVRDDAVDHVLGEHPGIMRAAAAKDDAAVIREAAPVRAKAQADLASIYGDTPVKPEMVTAPIDNLDARISALRASPKLTDEHTADALVKIRDALNKKLTTETTVKDLRALQSDLQGSSYGKAPAGDVSATANLAAHAEASKAIGDAVFQNVTGLDYKGAMAAARENPDGVSARLLRANQTINGLNRIEATVKSRADARREAPGLIGAVEHAVNHPVSTAADKLALPAANLVDRGLARVAPAPGGRIAHGADLLARTLQAAKQGNPWAAKTIQMFAGTPEGAARLAALQPPPAPAPAPEQVAQQ